MKKGTNLHWFNRVEETPKKTSLGIIRQERMSQPPWAQLTLGKSGRGHTEAKGVPVMHREL